MDASRERCVCERERRGLIDVCIYGVGGDGTLGIEDREDVVS